MYAARAIVRRDVGPGYTNIAIMGAYVALVAGELLPEPEILAYGKHRLRRFVDHTRQQGTFSEYNSPTYTVVALRELARIERDVQDGEMRALARDMAEVGWSMVARHFHPPTRQWAGPHSRCYATRLQARTLTYIQLALDGKVDWLDDDELLPTADLHRTVSPCPESLVPLFLALPAPRNEVDVLARSADGKPTRVGTAYLAPGYATASINHEHLWNQRRPLLAYVGTTECPGYVRLQALHDHYDFSSAHLVSAQQGRNILAAVGFATDGGDTHPSLDRIQDGRISLCDLRLRLKLGGSVAQSRLPDPADLPGPVTIDLGTATLCVQFILPPGANAPRFEVGRDGEHAWIDYVWFAGRRQTLTIADLRDPTIGIALSFDSPGRLPNASCAAEQDAIRWRWACGQMPLQVTLPDKPIPREAWQAYVPTYET
jgi:hypothetical protein